MCLEEQCSGDDFEILITMCQLGLAILCYKLGQNWELMVAFAKSLLLVFIK